MDTQYVRVENWSSDIDNVVKVILDYPSKRNCLSKNVMIELTKIINNINKADNYNNIKVIILTHEINNDDNKNKVFSSGHDLNEIYNNINNKQEIEEIFKICNKLMITVHESPIPIISMINGICTAAGFELVLASDIIICTKQSKFMTPGVNLGLFCHTPSVQLSRNLFSNKHAMQILLTGDWIDAQTAFRMGIVNFICNDIDQLLNKTKDIALKICSKSKAVIAFGKKSYQTHSKEKELLDAYKIASKNMIENLINYPDAKEGISAFLNKRKPEWSNLSPSKL